MGLFFFVGKKSIFSMALLGGLCVILFALQGCAQKNSLILENRTSSSLVSISPISKAENDYLRLRLDSQPIQPYEQAFDKGNLTSESPETSRGELLSPPETIYTALNTWTS